MSEALVVGIVRQAIETAVITHQLWEQLAQAAPDVEIVPVAGSGEAHVGAYYGITSLMQILHADEKNRLLAPGWSWRFRAPSPSASTRRRSSSSTLAPSRHTGPWRHLARTFWRPVSPATARPKLCAGCATRRAFR